MVTLSSSISSVLSVRSGFVLILYYHYVPEVTGWAIFSNVRHCLSFEKRLAQKSVCGVVFLLSREFCSGALRKATAGSSSSSSSTNSLSLSSAPSYNRPIQSRWRAQKKEPRLLQRQTSKTSPLANLTNLLCRFGYKINFQELSIQPE